MNEFCNENEVHGGSIPPASIDWNKMFKVGDRVKDGPIAGTIVEIYSSTISSVIFDTSPYEFNILNYYLKLIEPTKPKQIKTTYWK